MSDTNEFWAEGMRVGKRIGFRNGVEASAKWLADKGFKGTEVLVAALLPPDAPITTEDAERARYALRGGAGSCLCGQTTSAPNQYGIWVWPKGHAGYEAEGCCRES